MEEALRQRLHSIADVVAFCDYWVTTQSGFDAWQQYDDTWQQHDNAWQQYDGYDAVHQHWDLSDDFDLAAREQQEHDLHLLQECPAADDIAYLQSMCESLESQLLHMQQHYLHMQQRDQEREHAQDLEIQALMAALAEQELQRKQQLHTPAHVFAAACDPADAYCVDHSLELLACTPVADVPAAGLPVANLDTQQHMPCHADACEHPVPTCCDTPDSVPASPVVLLPYSSGCAPPTTVPTMGCNSSSLAPETQTPSRHGPINLQVETATYDEPSLIEELSGCPQHSPPLGMSHVPCYYYNMLALGDVADVTSPMLQASTTLSPASIQDWWHQYLATSVPKAPRWHHRRLPHAQWASPAHTGLV
jgi:hypothetical protein